MRKEPPANLISAMGSSLDVGCCGGLSTMSGTNVGCVAALEATERLVAVLAVLRLPFALVLAFAAVITAASRARRMYFHDEAV